MDLKELSKIDVAELSNIDYLKLLKDLKKRPELIVNFLSVFVAVIISWNIFLKGKAQLKNALVEIPRLEEKIQAINEFQTVRAEMDTFQANVAPAISEEKFINLMTDLASKRNIRILSLSPGKPETKDFYERLVVNLDVNSQEFSNIWLFVNDIESSDYPLKITSFSGSTSAPGARRGRRSGPAPGQDEGTINVKLKVVSTHVK